MAINENGKLRNRHAIFTATSGGGKSQALGQSELYKTAPRVLLWDTHNDFKADKYPTIAGFNRALAPQVRRGAGFRIGFNGEPTQANFDRFCRSVWAVLDGNRDTLVVIDEVAEVTGGPGKARGPLGQLLRGSRKYGGILYLAATRPAEIPKTVFSQCKEKYVGQMDTISDAKAMSDYLMVEPQDILNLDELQFFHKKRAGVAELITYKFKEGPL